VFYAVSVDEANVDQTTLEAAFKAWNVTLPIVRDPKADANKALGIDGIPSLLVIGKKGLIEHHWPRFDNTLPQALPNIINKLLAGESTHAATVRDYEQRLAEYQRWQQTPPTETLASKNMPLATATIAPASAPAEHTLQAAWTIDAEQIKQPGNILVVPGAEPAATRLLVLDGWNAVVEVDLDGKVLARHELNLPPKTAVTAIRSAVDRAGKRAFVLFHPYDERGQLYVFDDQWKQLLAFPRQEDLGEDRISDVQIADVTGDGTLKLVVGYSGATGVQLVSLTGDRIWRNRDQVRMSLRMALSEPREGAGRLIFCPNEQGTVIPLSDQGEAQPAWQIPGQRIIGLYGPSDAGPPAANQPTRLAGLLPLTDTRLNVVGFERGRAVAVDLRVAPGLARVSDRVRPKCPPRQRAPAFLVIGRSGWLGPFARRTGAIARSLQLGECSTRACSDAPRWQTAVAYRHQRWREGRNTAAQGNAASGEGSHAAGEARGSEVK
jgi:hypothetical protein